MAINTKIATDIAFKRLAANKTFTNPTISGITEPIGSNVQSSADIIFGEKIPSAPGATSTATKFDTASGVIQLVEFDLIAIGDSIYEADASGFGSTTANQFDTTTTFEGNIIDFQGQSFTAVTDIIVDIFKQGSRLSPTISRRVGVTKADANGDFELTLDPIEPDLIFQLSFTIVDTSTGAFTTFPFSNSNSHSGFEIKSA